MSTQIAMLDACVLYSASLRDLLMFLAKGNLFRARWTDTIQDEWIRSLLRNRPGLKRERLERTRSLMNSSIRDCLVTGYEDIVETLALPDPDDRHVLAAAIKAEASVIVTFNTSDFPADYVETFGVSAQHPDDFVAHLIDSKPEAACAAVRQHRQNLLKPSKTVEQYLATLSNQRLPETVLRLRKYAEFI